MKRESSASITDEEISTSTRRAKPMKLKVAGIPACTYGKQLINVEKQKVRNELKRAKAEKKTKKNVRA